MLLRHSPPMPSMTIRVCWAPSSTSWAGQKQQFGLSGRVCTVMGLSFRYGDATVLMRESRRPVIDDALEGRGVVIRRLLTRLPDIGEREWMATFRGGIAVQSGIGP